MTALIQHWVTEQAQTRPEAVAIVAGEERYTYGQLEAASNRLARMLQEQGCRPCDRVCFAMPKGIASFVALFGILKADCVFVPIDASGPTARSAKIVSSAEPKLLLAAGPVSRLVDEIIANPLVGDALPVGWLDDAPRENLGAPQLFRGADLAAFAATPPTCRNSGRDLAYILFTSGSTGMPKGVAIRHESVIAFIDWVNAYFGIGPGDRLSQHPPLHFDLSVLDVYSGLAAGAQLHLVPPELSLLPNKLAEYIRREELTQWVSVPSLLNYITKFDVVEEGDFPALRRVMWCGETFPTPALIYWMKRLPHVQFTNLYGPTEATCASSYYTIASCPTDETAAIPIGVPCPGEELLVLDDQLKPTPPDVKGDLFIGGIGLSAGYWRDPAKTSAAFIPDPRDPSRVIYRTGDLGSIGADGLYYMHGRADFQVKSRGYRIELGEIEAALAGVAEVREAVVVAIDMGGFEGATICCAYEPMAGSAVSPAQMRKALERVLPGYMIPNRWMKWDKIPKNANDKIDRRMLADRFREIVTAPVANRLLP